SPPERGVPRRGQPRLQPLLLPLHADAAARGQHHRRGLRLPGGGRGRPPQADPHHGQGHAVLRPAGLEALTAVFERDRFRGGCALGLGEAWPARARRSGTASRAWSATESRWNEEWRTSVGALHVALGALT